MEAFLITILHALAFWCAFKLGERLAFFRIAQGLQELNEQESETVNGIAVVEKIGENYYAYINNQFVAQGETLEKVHEAVQNNISKNPKKYFDTLKDQNSQQ